MPKICRRVLQTQAIFRNAFLLHTLFLSNEIVTGAVVVFPAPYQPSDVAPSVHAHLSSCSAGLLDLQGLARQTDLAQALALFIPILSFLSTLRVDGWVVFVKVYRGLFRSFNVLLISFLDLKGEGSVILEPCLF